MISLVLGETGEFKGKEKDDFEDRDAHENECVTSRTCASGIIRPGLTPLFSRAERAAFNLVFRKMDESEAVEASRCNSLLGGNSQKITAV